LERFGFSAFLGWKPSTGITCRELDRFADEDFCGVKPGYRQVLNLKGLELGVTHQDPAHRQPPNAQGADCKCANGNRTECCGYDGHAAQPQTL
jgi:hypothetical protein